ncbi:MAG: FeoA family protein, partial [Pyrinomonadaceae bacterium]
FNMTLKELPIGATASVKNVQDSGDISKRLMEMGVVPGVSVRVVKTAPFGDPMEIRLLGYNLAIRQKEAASVEIDGQ